ncbi:hypothetical protein M409DRAFT_37421 [Zasmidium cellare ATCC 36951]|uniref:Major facilitator superfamily (MFS) profile domain-containing protein n=1 Tax=Zasmidium cellare ATCC 36951 TaxID=1080233 RepID=A0A6A6CAG8_ZASCE|nr:uncharacterized protein M409DRAFT_37421 [Zasmidium cellare ATCC 36951]KAF2162446.1 hypothetical protein M409DRAFT_37421 [Zasmidium cellare ATCC 36951]
MEQRQATSNPSDSCTKEQTPASKNEKATPEPEVQKSVDDEAGGLEDSKDTEKQQPSSHESQEYCILPEWQKIALMLTASFAAIISPISSSIYLPAVNVLSRDLGVSISLINVTISTYLIFQGIAPSFTAALSENFGRRPAYMMCFVIYLGANIGLALQSDYAALVVLRCMQSSGSSGTIALGSAVVSDLATRAERGKYIGYASMGVTLGPALGPVIGGLLEHFLGWRSIFWFLTIFCGTFAIIIGVVFRETYRSIVGNGSIPPQKWNRSGLQWVSQDLLHRSLPEPDHDSLQKRRKRPNPLSSLLILRDRETCIIALFGASLFAGYSSVLSVLTSQLEARYHFNSIQIGLCYLPLGFGSLTSRWTMGVLLDRNFRREAKKQGLEVIKNKQQNIAAFDVEKARLAITIPFVVVAGASIVAYGWTMEFDTPLAAPLVVVFFTAHCATGAFSSLNTLVVDINREQPAIASAASNLTRCLLAAGAVAAANPLIDAIGIGWTSTICALVWVACLPLIWLVYAKGHEWRKAKAPGEAEV